MILHVLNCKIQGITKYTTQIKLNHLNKLPEVAKDNLDVDKAVVIAGVQVAVALAVVAPQLINMKLRDANDNCNVRDNNGKISLPEKSDRISRNMSHWLERKSKRIYA